MVAPSLTGALGVVRTGSDLKWSPHGYGLFLKEGTRLYPNAIVFAKEFKMVTLSVMGLEARHRGGSSERWETCKAQHSSSSSSSSYNSCDDYCH